MEPLAEAVARDRQRRADSLLPRILSVDSSRRCAQTNSDRRWIVGRDGPGSGGGDHQGQETVWLAAAGSFGGLSAAQGGGDLLPQRSALLPLIHRETFQRGRIANLRKVLLGLPKHQHIPCQITIPLGIIV